MGKLNEAASRVRPMRSIAVACFIFLGASAAAFADDKALRKELEARYDAMKAAMAERNADAVCALLAPGFQSIDTSGHAETAAQMCDEVKKLPVDPNKTSKTTLLSIRPSKDRVEVQQQYNMETLRQAGGAPGVKFTVVSISSDIWVRRGKTWLLEQTATDDTSAYLGDKLVLHKTRK